LLFFFPLASLQRAEERAEALEAKLYASEEAREKAQAEVVSIEELRQRLSKAKSALSDKITEQIAREQGIIDRLETQTRRFFRRLFPYLDAIFGLFSWLIMTLCFAVAGRNDERFELLEPKDDHLLDAFSILELQGGLTRTNLDESRAAFCRHALNCSVDADFLHVDKKFFTNMSLKVSQLSIDPGGNFFIHDRAAPLKCNWILCIAVALVPPVSFTVSR
jgi:hypothetical protein